MTNSYPALRRNADATSPERLRARRPGSATWSNRQAERTASSIKDRPAAYTTGLVLSSNQRKVLTSQIASSKMSEYSSLS